MQKRNSQRSAGKPIYLDPCIIRRTPLFNRIFYIKIAVQSMIFFENYEKHFLRKLRNSARRVNCEWRYGTLYTSPPYDEIVIIYGGIFMGSGYLTVKTDIANEAVPVKGATVVIRDANGKTLYTLKTDESGLTNAVRLYAPDKIHTLNPDYKGAPYSTYQIEVKKPGFVTEIIKGVQEFDTVGARQEVEMHPVIKGGETVHITEITPHQQVLTAPRNQQGPTGRADNKVMSRVIIPDYITVHLGKYNVTARNIRVPFPLYVKNVASSEIYPTWPQASLEANIRAIINFALNRVYTEWYRVRGFNFDITSSTANVTVILLYQREEITMTRKELATEIYRMYDAQPYSISSKTKWAGESSRKAVVFQTDQRKNDPRLHPESNPKICSAGKSGIPESLYGVQIFPAYDFKSRRLFVFYSRSK